METCHRGRRGSILLPCTCRCVGLLCLLSLVTQGIAGKVGERKFNLECH